MLDQSNLPESEMPGTPVHTCVSGETKSERVEDAMLQVIELLMMNVS